MATETTVVVENVGPARKRLKITIPATVVDARINEAYASARGEVQIPGFRKGTAPMALIEKRFGDLGRTEVRRAALLCALDLLEGRLA